MDTIKNFLVILLYTIFGSFLQKKSQVSEITSVTSHINHENRNLDKLIVKTNTEIFEVPAVIFTEEEINRLWDILGKKK